MSHKVYIDSVIGHFSNFHFKGWITARDGNACFAYRDRFVVTASGVKKQSMDKSCFIGVNSKAERVYFKPSEERPQLGPSIETKAHIGALEVTGERCSLHIHTPKTVALFTKHENKGTLSFLHTMLNSQWPEFYRYTNLGRTVPYLEPGSEPLHVMVKKSFAESGTKFRQANIIVLARHGIFAVGNDFDICAEHAERLEHVSSILLDMGY